MILKIENCPYDKLQDSGNPDGAAAGYGRPYRPNPRHGLCMALREAGRVQPCGIAIMAERIIARSTGLPIAQWRDGRPAFFLR